MKISASIGEVVDKATILAIKVEKFTDSQKLANAKKELEVLLQSLSEIQLTPDSSEFGALKKVNLKLWDIEDQIRIKEQKKEFDAKFIELARSVYFNNDDRANIKREINLKFQSDLIEEKQYVSYR